MIKGLSPSDDEVRGLKQTENIETPGNGEHFSLLAFPKYQAYIKVRNVFATVGRVILVYDDSI